MHDMVVALASKCRCCNLFKTGVSVPPFKNYTPRGVKVNFSLDKYKLKYKEALFSMYKQGALDMKTTNGHFSCIYYCFISHCADTKVQTSQMKS